MMESRTSPRTRNSAVLPNYPIIPIGISDVPELNAYFFPQKGWYLDYAISATYEMTLYRQSPTS